MELIHIDQSMYPSTSIGQQCADFATGDISAAFDFSNQSFASLGVIEDMLDMPAQLDWVSNHLDQTHSTGLTHFPAVIRQPCLRL